jgi:hypothetical protein
VRSYDGLALVARCVFDDSLSRSRETAPKRHSSIGHLSQNEFERRYAERGTGGLPPPPVNT